MVLEVARAASASLDLDRIANNSLDVLLNLGDLDAAALLMVSRRTGAVLAVPSRGVRRADMSLDDEDFDALQYCTRCVKANEVVLVSPTPVVERRRSQASAESRALHVHAFLPLCAESRVLAVLHVTARRANPFTARDVEKLSEAATYLAAALHNAQKHGETERQNRILRGLNEIGDLLNQSPRINETLGVTLSRILEMTSAESGTVLLGQAVGATDGAASMQVAAHQGPPDPLAAGNGSVGVASAEVEEVVRSGRMKVWCPAREKLTGIRGKANDDALAEVLPQGAERPSDGRGAWQERHPPASLVSACVPLHSKGQVLGVLKLSGITMSQWSDEELDFLEHLGRLMGVAIENGTQFRTISEQALHLSRRTGHLSTLLEMSDLMARTVELEGNIDACVQRLGELVATPIVLVLNDDGGGQARFIASYVDRKLARRIRRVPHGLLIPWKEVPAAERALTDQRLVMVDDGMSGLTANEARWMRANDVHFALVLPLVVNGVGVGAMVLACTDRRRMFNPSELDFARTVANQLAMAIERERLFREVKEAARWLERRVEDRTRELRDTNVRLQEASRQRSDFLKVMSHELRTPLNAILGFSEIMADEETPVDEDEMREYSSHILESGRNLLRMVNDILDLANTQPTGDEMQLEPLKLDSVFSSVLDVIRPQALARGVVLHNTVGAEAPVLLTDRSRLKQILYNLVSNAVKFSALHGRVTIGVREEGAFASIWVEDEGVGIPLELQEKIFEPFFQADGSISRTSDGAGLGLSLARRYVRMLGGELWVHSVQGRGSRFEFTIPLNAGPLS